MSDLQNTTATEKATTDPTIAPETDVKPEETPRVEPSHDASAVESSKADEIQALPEAKDQSAPAEEKKDEAAPEKPIEPITEGQLALKGPGLLKYVRHVRLNIDQTLTML